MHKDPIVFTGADSGAPKLDRCLTDISDQALSQVEIGGQEISQGALLVWGWGRRRDWTLAQPCGSFSWATGSSEAGILLQDGL